MNSSGADVLRFVDSLDFILRDCRSGDPNRRSSCIISTVLGAFTGLILPLFVLLGLVCNALVVYINLFCYSDLTRQNVYLSMIALADNCNIFLNGFMWLFLAKGLPWLSNGTAGFIHVNISTLICSVVRYWEHIFHATSPALFMLMVWDRVLSLYFPFRLRGVGGKSALVASMVTILCCLLVTVPMGYLYHWIYDDGSVVCYVEPDMLLGWANAAFFYYNILLYYPPFLFLVPIFVGNGLLIIKVRQIIANRKHLTESGATDKQGIQNSVVCVTLSFVLLVFNLPIAVSCVLETLLEQLYPNLATEGDAIVILWGMLDIGVALVCISQSVNWYFLAWKSAKFRKELLRIVRCRRG